MPPGLRIPPLPRTGPMNARWKRAVKDWEEPDLSRGHSITLKQWHPSWYTGLNRERFGVQYRKRKLIALEFIDELPLTVWPVAGTEGPSKLLEAMQKVRLESGTAKRRTSKYGDPVIRLKSRNKAKRWKRWENVDAIATGLPPERSFNGGSFTCAIGRIMREISLRRGELNDSKLLRVRKLGSAKVEAPEMLLSQGSVQWLSTFKYSNADSVGVQG
ncbi:hypothetical protein K439DRAFT_1621040 [Ramaria rubella]|nr:hypothetical protein K439DRAFT_1621040 [Ramaria rubella]